MKKLKFILIAFFFTCISCSDDDSSNSNNQDSILGKWKITEIKLITTIDLPDGTEEEQQSLNTQENCSPAPTWEFFSNGELERRELEIDLEDDSCFVGDLFEIDTWERIDDNIIKINEGTDTQSEFKVTFNGSNQVEMSSEEIDAGTMAEVTIFLRRP